MHIRRSAAIFVSILWTATGGWAELQILDQPVWVFPGQMFRIALGQPAGSGELRVDYPGNVEMFDRWDQDERQRFYFRALEPGDATIRFAGAGGELEITDLNRAYLERGQLNVMALGRGMAWLDAGTHETLLQAAQFIQAVEERQGIMISSPDEIAYRMGFISREELSALAENFKGNGYGAYLQKIAAEEPGIDI